MALALGCAEGQSDDVDVKTGGGDDAALDKEGDPKGDAEADDVKSTDDVAQDAVAEDVASVVDAQAPPDGAVPSDAAVTPDRALPADAAPDVVAVMDVVTPDVPPPPPDLPPPPPDLPPPPPDVTPPPPDVSTGLVCNNGLIRQSCRASENCCVSIGPVIGCGCAIPIVGCVLRGLPGCT